ncbi:unnamed protein product [Agarophyton chilense]
MRAIAVEISLIFQGTNQLAIPPSPGTGAHCAHGAHLARPHASELYHGFDVSVDLLLAVICFAQDNENNTLLEILRVEFRSTDGVGALVFPQSLLRSETPIATRSSLLYGIVLHEVSAGCLPVALSFLGEREPIEPRFCSSPLSILLLRHQLTYRLWESEFPLDAEPYGRFLDRLGLEPYDKTVDRNVERGWANAVGNKLVNFFANDGWNSQGDLSKKNYRQSYQDYTDYKPINRADLEPHQLFKPLRWQPLTRPSDFRGKFEMQVHVTPQFGVGVEPLTLSRAQFEERMAPPLYSNSNKRRTLSRSDKRLAITLIDKLFNLSRQTTLDNVILSYRWESKFSSLGGFVGISTRTYGLNTTTFYQVFLGDMTAQYDALLVAWKEKRRHDLVRPPTLTRHLFPNKKVTAFKGIGKGIGDVAAAEWEPIVPIQPHSEYPSASAVICTAALEALESSLKAIALEEGEALAPFSFTIRRGRSLFLPIDRVSNVTFATIEEAIQSCGKSRLTSGVHFEPSVSAGQALGRGIGKIAFQHVQDLYNGKVPDNCVRCLGSTA